ncbi:MAG: diacylglycerol kinase family protein [bacterium]
MSNFNLPNFLKSFTFAFRGLKTLLFTQQNARIHLIATIVVLIAGFYFDLNRPDWLWIVLAIALVFITESINTAIELLADVASPEFHPLIRKAKDVAAGAVLLAAFAACVIGILVFSPYIFD